MSITVNGTNGLTFNDGSAQNTAATGFGFKNRLINGAMVISQRYGTTNTTVGAGSYYGIDRWRMNSSQANKISFQQQGIASPQSCGNNRYTMNVTSLAATTVGSTDYYGFNQFVEAFNMQDLGWGTSGAQAVTLSFWVYSSVAGTYSGAIRTGDSSNYSYPFTYTVNSTNTWEQKTITISGPTSGSWGAGNAVGLDVWFSLGSGSTFKGTAGAWASANYVSATGEIALVNTNGATFYITGVQLEKGSTATSFDYRPYGTELALCQRYYQKFTGTTGQFTKFGAGVLVSSTVCNGIAIPMKVSMRTQPAISGSGFEVYDGAVTRDISSYNNLSSPEGISFDATCSGASFTAYRPGMVGCGLTTDYLEASAEL